MYYKIANLGKQKEKEKPIKYFLSTAALSQMSVKILQLPYK